VLRVTAPDTFNTYEDRFYGYNYGSLNISFEDSKNPSVLI